MCHLYSLDRNQSRLIMLIWRMSILSWAAAFTESARGMAFFG